MPQIFNRSSVLLMKVVLLAVVGLLCGTVAIAHWIMTPAEAGAYVPQPVPFSHKHHVGDLGIDCRFCHAGVERSAFAGLPSTQPCLTCHSQLFRDAPMLQPLHASALRNQPLAWNRVHDLPDFVYFDHSIHVNKGVACLECHGRVDQMPLMQRQVTLDMQWCLGCHRDPARHIRPLNEVFSMQDAKPLSADEVRQLQRLLAIQSRTRLQDCSTCHR